MHLFVVFLVMLAAGAWLNSRVIRYVRDNTRLRSCAIALQGCVLLWGVVILGKVVAVYSYGHVSDSMEHEEKARFVADCLWAGNWEELSFFFRFGNWCYQLLLGVFYAITSAPPEIIVIFNGCLAFLGLLGLLDTLSRATPCKRVPSWLAVLICASPSALYWTTLNLKEGIMLWALCGITRLILFFHDRTTRAEVRFPVLEMLAGLLLRPHFAVVWLFAASTGILLRRRAFGVIPVLLVGIGIAYWALSSMVPQIMLAIQDLGANQALGERYQETRDQFLRGIPGGGSTIVYSGGGPVPVLSGLAVILLRPYPDEVNNIASALAGAEVWGLSLLLGFAWFNARNRLRLLWTSMGICCVTAMLLFGFMFSYYYNLGLAARQRLQVFPVVFALIAMPILSKQQSTTASDRGNDQNSAIARGSARGNAWGARPPHVSGPMSPSRPQRIPIRAADKTTLATATHRGRPPERSVSAGAHSLPAETQTPFDGPRTT